MSEATATETGERPGWLAVLRLTACPAWLRLTRAERDALIADQVRPVLEAYPVTVEWVDVEAFSAAPSDLLIARFADPVAWYELVESLRDTPVFSEPYFEVVSIDVGLIDGYLAYQHRESGRR